jgi:hypothetical protein
MSEWQIRLDAAIRVDSSVSYRALGGLRVGLSPARHGTFSVHETYPLPERIVMKAYFTNLPMRIWLLLVVPPVVIAYPVVRIVVPAVVHAVVPEAVRTVLSVI